MADGVFNISKGAIAEKIRDGAANIELVLLKAAEVDSELEKHDDMASLLAESSNIEADFDNYERKENISGTVTVDDVNARTDCDFTDQVWLVAGGTVNNTLAKMIVCYRESVGDANLIPMTHHDYVTTTDGSNLAPQLHSEGFYRAS